MTPFILKAGYKGEPVRDVFHSFNYALVPRPFQIPTSWMNCYDNSSSILTTVLLGCI